MTKASSFKSQAVGIFALVFAVVAIGGTTLAVVYERASNPEFNACYAPETGVWRNRNARSGDVSRIEVETECQDNRLVHRTRTFTKCAPRDCTWGWTKGIRAGNGRFQAIYTTYSAHRFVELAVNDSRMDAYVENDFHDPRKKRERQSFTLRRAD
ncbi:hypothetical protein [Breoghania sp. L-A4]|uniref:hypothetical protein n=1 Tax=Breoghania sp. L-A4 TaxID=2304600 RepID=UPI000E358A07|nr:hypothetical protein [Breoghania sp. L-A4]AXS39044.1 hypothetical protein D1F64_01910 [Breoghania sp. L-A4]